MCEMFFPAFENVHDSLAAPFCNRPSNTRLKPVFLSSINAQSTVEDGSSAGCSKVKNKIFDINPKLMRENV